MPAIGEMAVVKTVQGDPIWLGFGEFTTQVRKPILVGIGMFAEGTSWILTHGEMEGTLTIP